MSYTPTVSSTRDPGIDLVKIVGMVMVIMNHPTGCFVREGIFNLPWALYYASLAGVPLFLMASGYLLLPRNPDKIPYSYILRKIWAVMRLLAIMIIPSFLWHQYSDPDFSPQEYFMRGSHLWYLWALIPIFIFYRPLAYLYTHPRAFRAVLAIMLSALCVITYLNYTAFFESQIPRPLRLWTWLAYFMLGGVMHKIMIPRNLLAVLFLASLAALYIQTWYFYQYPFTDLGLEYILCAPFSILYSVLLFAICREARVARWKSLRIFADLFLPVYVLHWAILARLSRFFEFTHFGGGLPLCVLTLAVTLVLSRIIMRTRIGRWIFHL